MWYLHLILVIQMNLVNLVYLEDQASPIRKDRNLIFLEKSLFHLYSLEHLADQVDQDPHVDLVQYHQYLLNHLVHPNSYFYYIEIRKKKVTFSPIRPGIPGAPGRPSNPPWPSSPGSPYNKRIQSIIVILYSKSFHYFCS